MKLRFTAHFHNKKSYSCGDNNYIANPEQNIPQAFLCLNIATE